MRTASPELVAIALLLALAATSPINAQTSPTHHDAAPELSSPPAPPDFGDQLDEGELVAAVLDRNPTIVAAQAAWREAVARIEQAQSLEDPRVSYSLAPLTIGSSSRFGEELRASQAIPWPGTRSLRRQAAEAVAAVNAERVDEVRLRLAAMARTLFAEYWRVSRSQHAVEDHVLLLGEMKEVATARYAAGLVPQQAPLQVEVEASHAHHDIVQLAASRRRVIVQINALLHEPIDRVLPPPADLERSNPLPVGKSAPEAAPIVVDRATGPGAVNGLPEVRALREQVGADRLRVTLRERERYPDLEISTAYMSFRDDPNQRWVVGVGVKLPLWGKRIRAGIEEAKAGLASSEARLASRLDSAHAEIATAEASLTEALDVIELYRDRVLPASRDQVAAARVAFEAGTADMLNSIDAARSLRTAELEYYRAVAGLATVRAELDRALGRLPDVRDTPQGTHNMPTMPTESESEPESEAADAGARAQLSPETGR